MVIYGAFLSILFLPLFIEICMDRLIAKGFCSFSNGIVFNPYFLYEIFSEGKRGIMVIFAFIHIPAHYDAESINMVYSTELYGSDFFASRVEPGNETPIHVNYVFAPLLDFYHPLPFNDRWGINPWSSGIYNPSNASLEYSTYVIHSKQTSNWLLYAIGYDSIKLWLESNKKSKLIYTNGYYEIYKNNIIL